MNERQQAIDTYWNEDGEREAFADGWDAAMKSEAVRKLIAWAKRQEDVYENSFLAEDAIDAIKEIEGAE